GLSPVVHRVFGCLDGVFRRLGGRTVPSGTRHDVRDRRYRVACRGRRAHRVRREVPAENEAPMIRARRALLAALVIVAASARPALACPVCFGASDAPMAVATNLGIIAMLVVVVGVLTAFAAFFIYLMRRARMAA